MVPQEITEEHLETALELLWLLTQGLMTRGIPLWKINRIILPLYEGEFSVLLPVGTEDVLNVNLRTLQRLTGTASATEGVADNAFDGDLTTACTQVAAAGSITMELATATAASTFGILPNAAGSWDFVIEASNDGITYTPLLTRTGVTMVAGEWAWYDVEGVSAFSFYRLRATGTTVLDVIELVYQNLPREIPLPKVNRDEYSDLPDKTFPSRPTEFWYNKQRTQQILTIWPAPLVQYTFAQLTCYVVSQIEDVGALTDELEVPDRWYLAIVCLLAKHLAREIKEVKLDVIPVVDADAAKEVRDAWDSEDDGSPIYLNVDISPYTR